MSYDVAIKTGAIVAFASLCFLAAADEFSLRSKTFKQDGPIPAKCAMREVSGGKNLSPALVWENAPRGTKSFVLSCVDKNPVAHDWVHWMVLNIPVSTHSLKAGASPEDIPKGAVELKNSFGFRGYGGPQPPAGTGVHDYVFTLYALNVESIPVKGAFLPAAALPKILHGKVLGTCSLIGTLER